ncbi:MAG: EamA family transporter [Acidobacteria bacterium]|nr:EamA family transporter [Acidobacteriota bacterium]
MNNGLWYGIAAYLSWGVSPLYWKQLGQLSPAAVVGYRVFWSLILLGLLLVVRPQYRFQRGQLSVRVIATYSTTAALLYANWLTFVWAVTAGYIVESSLGYFLSPLLSVGLGVLVLGERLRSGQWVAVGLATSGIVYLTISVGTLPWIALLLASTFGVYGLLKKQASLGAVQGLRVCSHSRPSACCCWVPWSRLPWRRRPPGTRGCIRRWWRDPGWSRSARSCCSAPRSA